MPNPAIIPRQSSRTQHFLEIADVFIALGMPEVFEVEPNVSEEYRPDVYFRLPDKTPICVEVQRSVISNVKMQEKVDAFVQTARKKKHDARQLWIISDKRYDVKAPSGFTIVQKEKAAIC